MFDVSYVVDIILQITRDVLSTKSHTKNIPTTSSETIHSSCTNKKYPTNSTRNYICPNNQAKFLRAHKYIARVSHKSKPSGNQ
jgi:hypothetical protein